MFVEEVLPACSLLPKVRKVYLWGVALQAGVVIKMKCRCNKTRTT